MALVNATYLQQYSGVLRWLDESGNSVKTTTLSDTNVSTFAWGQDGEYFYTASAYSTGRIEKWARDGTAYSLRRTGIDNVNLIAPDSSGNLFCVVSDDIYLLGADDLATDYSDIGNEFYRMSATALALDSSDNAYVGATDYYYYTEGLWIYVFDNTCTLSTSFQVSTGSFEAKKIAIDSSGNIFVGWSYRVSKFNSSGTLQWTYDPSGSTIGTVTDIQIANGYIFCTNGADVACLTDNGGSYTEEWNVDVQTSYGFYATLLAVTSDQVITLSGSASYDIAAIDPTDGSEDTNFTPYDITGAVVAAGIDPLAAVTCGAFGVLHEIQYSRWVLRGGTISDCGPLETTDAFTIRGFGDALIDKLYLGGKYIYTSTAPRYGYWYMNGQPPTEELGYRPSAYPFYTENYKLVTDKENNVYIQNYAAYTAQEAYDKSNGYYSSADNYYTILKLDKDGSVVWNSDIVIGTLQEIAIDLDFEYVYATTTFTGGCVFKFSCVDGVGVYDSYWPLDLMDFNDVYRAMRIGRDNKLYFVAKDVSSGTYAFDYVHKYNLDGTTATNWSTPYEVPCPEVNGTRSVRDIDINASGYIALGCRRVSEYGDALEVVAPDKTQYYSYAFPGSGVNAYGCSNVLIDDDGYVVCQGGDQGVWRIPPTGGSYTEIVAKSGADGYILNQFWSTEGDQEYFYMSHSLIVYVDENLRKYKSSDGTLIWTWGSGPVGSANTHYFLRGVAALPSPAWAITVTFGTNGHVKTYSGDSNAPGTELTSGDVVYAEVGRDYKFSFVGDAGYYVDEVTVDSVNLGYRSDYTFTNVQYRHTLHVTFGTGFPSGPFTMAYSMTGGILSSIVAGHLSYTSEQTLGAAKWLFLGGPHQETYAITGTGYLPWHISLLYLINSYRSSNGVASVQVDEWLVDGADYAIADMIANGTLTKTMVQIMGQDGANYPYLYAGGIPTIADESFTPQNIFDAWTADGPTEAMILSENYDEVGITVENYAGDNYIFVLFASWHPQYQVVRADEYWDAPQEFSPEAVFFEFWSAAEYTTFIENSSGIKLPGYQAKIGDYTIPKLISFSYRLFNDKPSSIQLVIPYQRDTFEEIKTRIDANDGISIESVVTYKAQTVTTEVLQASISDIEFRGGKSPIITLAGATDTKHYQVEVPLRNIVTKVKDIDGKLRFRCSHPDFYLRPGCTVTYSGGSIVVGEIVVNVSSGVSQIMEVKEA